MNWLAVIRASRENLSHSESQSVARVDIFEEDEGNEVAVDPLAAAALAEVLRTSSAQLRILALGSAPSVTTFSRDGLVEVFEETERSLRRDASFAPLFEHARKAAMRLQETQWLQETAARNLEKLTGIRSKLQGNQRTKEKELHKKQEVIASLKDQIQELVRRKDVTLSYVDAVLDSKRQQNAMRCDIAEKALHDEICEVSHKTEQEAGVHDSLVSYLNYAIQELNEKFATWTEFYHEEMLRRNEKIKTMKANIADEKIKVAGLQELYDEHQREIVEYLEYKEQKRIEAEHDQFLYDNATKIQAWWRGVMVRRCLGPFKKKKKKPSKDKKSKR